MKSVSFDVSLFQTNTNTPIQTCRLCACIGLGHRGDITRDPMAKARAGPAGAGRRLPCAHRHYHAPAFSPHLKDADARRLPPGRRRRPALPPFPIE
jgi:hypothetical protein